MKKSFNELIVEKLSNNIDYAWINWRFNLSLINFFLTLRSRVKKYLSHLVTHQCLEFL